MGIHIKEINSMDRITFVMKGKPHDIVTFDEQKRELTKYVLDHVNAVQINETQDSTVYETNEHYLNKIVQWFATDSHELIKGFGYPIGTCLIYSIHKDETGITRLRYEQDAGDCLWTGDH
jgi:hypothetical protein